MNFAVRRLIAARLARACTGQRACVKQITSKVTFASQSRPAKNDRISPFIFVSLNVLGEYDIARIGSTLEKEINFQRQFVEEENLTIESTMQNFGKILNDQKWQVWR